jgi:hypothetical protein
MDTSADADLFEVSGAAVKYNTSPEVLLGITLVIEILGASFVFGGA